MNSWKKPTPEQKKQSDIVVTKITQTLNILYPNPSKEEKAIVAYALSMLLVYMLKSVSDEEVISFITLFKIEIERVKGNNIIWFTPSSPERAKGEP